jgi:hypothetical protein
MKTNCVYTSACALIFALLGTSAALAQNVAKQTPARSIPVKKMFPFYDLYLGLPIEGRDGFAMAYRLSLPASAPRPQLTYVLGTTRTPVEISANGQIVNMPDRGMLTSGRVDIAANQPRSSITMDLEPVIPLARVVSVVAATNPITDYTNAVRRAGPVAAFAPKLKGIVFKGGAGGEAVFSDGRRVPLPSTPRGMTFQPSAPNMRGAVSLAFSTPPTSAEFSQ